MRGFLALFLAAADAAHVPVPQHVIQMSELDTIFEENGIDIDKPNTIEMIKEELDDNAAAQDFNDVQNFMGDYPNPNDNVYVSRTFLLTFFVIIPMMTMLVALFYPTYQSFTNNDTKKTAQNEKEEAKATSESKSQPPSDTAPVIVVKKDPKDDKSEKVEPKPASEVVKAEAGAPVSAPLYAADDQLPEEHLSLIIDRIATSHPNKVRACASRCCHLSLPPHLSHSLCDLNARSDHRSHFGSMPCTINADGHSCHRW